MRRCKVCGEQLDALFSFCPLDGTHFGQAFSEAPHSEFTLTIVSDVGLIQRLAVELNFLIEEVKQAWLSFRDRPVAFTTNQLVLRFINNLNKLVTSYIVGSSCMLEESHGYWTTKSTAGACR